MLDQIVYGVQAAILHMTSLLLAFLTHQLVIGFAIGFLAATGIYSLLLAEEPKHIPIILAHRQHVCFEKIAIRNPDGTFQTSYTNFEKVYNRVKTLFYLSVLLFLLILAWALLMH